MLHSGSKGHYQLIHWNGLMYVRDDQLHYENTCGGQRLWCEKGFRRSWNITSLKVEAVTGETVMVRKGRTDFNVPLNPGLRVVTESGVTLVTAMRDAVKFASELNSSVSAEE